MLRDRRAAGGARLGRTASDVGQVGYEFRVLLGWSTIAIAMPLLKDRARARCGCYRGMLGVGIAVGIYGLLQYFELLTFFAEGQAGLREGVGSHRAARARSRAACSRSRSAC